MNYLMMALVFQMVCLFLIIPHKYGWKELDYPYIIPFSTVGRDEKGDKPRSYAICRLLCL